MAANLTSVDSMLKIDYIGPIRDMLNHKVSLLQFIEQTTEYVVGKQFYIPLNIARNSGIGARAESGTLPTAGQQGYGSATFNAKYNYARGQITGPAMAASKNDSGAFARALDMEIEGMVRDFADDMNRQLWGDGTGTLAVINADPGAQAAQTVYSPAATTSTLTRAINTTEGAKTMRDISQINWLTQRAASGDIQYDIFPTDFGVPAAGNLDQNLVSIARNAATSNVTFGSAAVDPAAVNDRIIKADAVTGHATPANVVFNEMFGLFLAISNHNGGATAGTPNGLSQLYFGGVNRSVAAGDYYAANVVENGGTLRDLSLELMETAIDEADIRGNGEITHIFTNHALYRKYAQLLLPDRRYPTADGMTIEMDGGYKTLQYDGIPIIKDKHAPDYNMFFIDKSSLVFLKMADVDWIDQDGSIMNRIANTDAFEFTLFMYANLGAYDPKNNTRLADLVQ